MKIKLKNILYYSCFFLSYFFMLTTIKADDDVYKLKNQVNELELKVKKLESIILKKNNNTGSLNT